MGLFDNVLKTTYVDGIVDIKSIHELLDEKLGKKYKVKFVPKSNSVMQMIGGDKQDQVFIIKNAYHRTYISLTHLNKQLGIENDETLFGFNRDDLNWWLAFLHNNTGIIGALIIRLLYGSSEPFDKEILEALKSKFDVKTREDNYGLSKLWKKDSQAS